MVGPVDGLTRHGRQTLYAAMVKTITKVGNSQGIIFDAALMDLAGLKLGDEVNVTVHEGGSVVLTPLRKVIAPEKAGAAAKKVIARNRTLFKRLA